MYEGDGQQAGAAMAHSPAAVVTHKTATAMNVKITKPDSSLYDGKARLVQLPGTGGIFEILENHAPIISSLGKGTVRLVDNEEQEHTFEVRGGVVKCQQNDLLILVQ